MRARAPASAANLGPGFDVLALALDLYVEVEVEPAPRLSVRTEGEGAGLADDASHLAARVAIDVAGHDQLSITVRSQIPVARGLGSSAALALAAAAAAGSPDPLAVAARIDGHPENAVASKVGGLIAATTVRGAVKAVRMPLDPFLAFAMIVPDRALPTARARQVLPDKVSRQDASFNLGRMALLLAGLADHRVLVKEAGEDRLHQDYRSPLFPEAPQLLAGMLSGGARVTCWSGAGPSMMGVCTLDEVERLAHNARRLMDRIDLPGRVLILRPDVGGLVTGPEARLGSVLSGPGSSAQRSGGPEGPTGHEERPATGGPPPDTGAGPAAGGSGGPAGDREIFDFDKPD